MGHTHYWTFRGQPNSIAYARALRDINKLARSCKDLLSGYSAHAPANVYTGVKFNGKREEACEDFTLRALPRDAANGFFFCKTNENPYDLVVMAALAILKHRLGEQVTIDTDGLRSDWTAGVKLAQKVTKLAIINPIKAKVTPGWGGSGFNNPTPTRTVRRPHAD